MPLGWVGLGAVCWSVLTYDSATPFPGTAALVPVLGAAAVIAAGATTGAAEPRLRAGALLATPAARWVGRLSYSLYLWHWALLVVVQVSFPDLSWLAKAAVVAVSALPAYLTMRLVEDPVRRSAVVRARPLSGLSVGVTAMVLPAVAASS